ncbi:MAG TPA: hypothetical protein PK640_13570 [Verrucomicrobiota bacterium]|nr:hypothetical protein [Verrucomicrobiota bacterium]
MPGLAGALLTCGLLAADLPPAFPEDPLARLERTCFQTGQGWSPNGNLRSDVAIVYGIDPALGGRIRTWRDRGYRIHVMTGVSWGNYQDYLYGRFDGVNHEDEAQTDRQGRKISHGGDVYYMCPGENYGRFLCVGVQRALDAGVDAIHLEEPEFWVRGGYSEGFKRAWRAHYSEDWQPPHTSVDAQWRASKLKYFLYRRALQQVFDCVQDWNRRTGKRVRCYVPSHSLLNYAHWRIVSPESSLGRLDGCDGYIAQVWTGTSRTPNLFRGKLKERTFETAFLEYGSMQDLVRSTGRTVWYLNDPIEDNPDHDWEDYRTNWESTLVASLLQPDVWQYEVAPWPERVFGGRYPKKGNPQEREPIPPAYAAELQTVFNALNDLRQTSVRWDCGTEGLGILVSDSLMFQRGDPAPSDPHLSHVYGLALPLLKRGMPVAPVVIENITSTNSLNDFAVLLMSYHGQKPMSEHAHRPLADWVRAGGVLVVWDDDSDPYNQVREWWNTEGRQYATPRIHLFEQLGLAGALDPAAPADEGPRAVGKGAVLWRRDNPAHAAASVQGDSNVVASVKAAVSKSPRQWRETNYLLLERGPYVVAAGLDESVGGAPKTLRGRFVNLFDPDLKVRVEVTIEPGSRWFLIDLDKLRLPAPTVLASACKTLPVASAAASGADPKRWHVEGVAGTPAIVLLHAANTPKTVTLAGQQLDDWSWNPDQRLVWIRFGNTSTPRELSVQF